MGKNIKKTTKFLAILILIIMGLGISLWTALRSPAVQTVVVKKVLADLSEKLGVTITTGRIHYSLNKTLVVKDICLYDKNNDTLLYINKLTADIKDVNIKKHTFLIEEISLRRVECNIAKEKNGEYNFSFITDKLKSDNPKPFSWRIESGELSVKGSSLTYKQPATPLEVIDEFNLSVSEILVDSVQQFFTVEQCRFNYSGKEFLKELYVHFEKTGNIAKALGLRVKTNNSDILIKNVKAFLPVNKNGKWAVKGKVNHSEISPADVAVFIKKINKEASSLFFSGIIDVTDKYFKGSNILFKTGESSTLSCNVRVMDYSNRKNIRYYLNIKNMHTTKDDVYDIIKDYVNGDSIKIPAIFDKINNLTYMGVVKGGEDSLTNIGHFTLPVGNIETHLSLKKVNKSGKIKLNGQIKTFPLYLTPLMKDSINSEIAFDLSTDGYIDGKDVDLQISGDVGHFEYNNYKMDSVDISGHLINRMFEGRISSFDSKFRFDFDGKVNFDTLPSYNFMLNVYYLNLYRLGVNKKDKNANLSFVLKTDFSGNNLFNTMGSVEITDLYYFTDSMYFATDSISIQSKLIPEGKEMHLYSEYLTADITGNYNSITVVNSAKYFINSYFPTFFEKDSVIGNHSNYSFNVNIDYLNPITRMFFPKLKIAPGTSIYGRVNTKENKALITCQSKKIGFDNRYLKNINVRIFTRKDYLSVNLISDEFKYFKNTSLKNFSISTVSKNDSVNINFNWNNWLRTNYSGNINTILSFRKRSDGVGHNFKLDILPSNVNVLDTIWFIGKGYVDKMNDIVVLNNLQVDNGYSGLLVQGVYSSNPTDSIDVKVKNISVDYLNNILKNDKLVFNGNLTGNAKVKDIKGEVDITADMFIEQLSLNKKTIGDTRLLTSWDKKKNNLWVRGESSNDSVLNFEFEGSVSPKHKEIDIQAHFYNQDLNILQPFLEPTFDRASGLINGDIKLYGDLRNPSWRGGVFIKNAKLRVTPINVNYRITDSIFFDDHNILFRSFRFADRDSNIAIMNGKISHIQFRDFFYDLRVNSDKVLGVNLKSSDNPYYYGTVYGSGYVEIKGSDDEININVAAKTKDYSTLIIPLEGKEDIKENNFIEFVSGAQKDSVISNIGQLQQEEAVESSVTNLRIDLDVTPDVEVQIIFDPQIGDRLRANGYAHIVMEALGPKFNMYGDYTITKGDFMFTLQNLMNKKFEIEQGSRVSWTGDPINADIDLDAIYKVRRALVYDLTKDEADKEKRVEVNTHLLMTGKLVNPNIKFSVEVPSATHDEAIDQLNSLPEEELNKQVLSLLLVNKFTPLQVYQSGLEDASAGNIGAKTASELLSNQLTNWMSQISTDFDMGIVYRPGDANTQQEVEVALSTNVLNDRMLINGNFGYSENMRNLTNNPYTGDIQVEYKVNKKGNIRLRAFQKANNDITYTQAPYTQGVGIFYTEEFNNFDELINRLFHKEVAKKPEEIKIEENKE